MSDEEMEKERFVSLDTQLFFSPISKNQSKADLHGIVICLLSNCHGAARSVATFGVTIKSLKFNTHFV